MGLIQRNGIFHASFFDKTKLPHERRFSLRTRNRPEARRQLVRLELDWSEGRFDPWRDDPRTYLRPDEPEPAPAPERPRNVRDALHAFLDQKALEGRSEKTLISYRTIVDQLARRTAAALCEVTARDIEQFVRQRGLAKASQHMRFNHLRAFFRWCAKRGMIETNPVDAVEAPAKPQQMPKAVTEAELDAICRMVWADYVAKRKRRCVGRGEMVWRIPLFRFAFATGMRISELARLCWDDIDFDQRLIYIRVQKNKREQTIPLNRRASAILDQVKGSREGYVFRSPREHPTRHERNFAERASEAFRRARKLAGIKRPVSFHGLRHGFCSALAAANKSAFTIQAAARHQDIQTTMRYVHMANAQLKAELDDVFD